MQKIGLHCDEWDFYTHSGGVCKVGKCVGLRVRGEEDFCAHVCLSTCLSFEGSIHGLVPSIVGDGEVINSCVKSWADWTSLWGDLD